MTRWGELIPHTEDDPACLCGCQDEDATGFVFCGHPHVIIKPQRRYGQAGYLIQRVHTTTDRLGHAYWVAARLISQEVLDAYGKRSA